MTTYPCRITALLAGELISTFLTKNTEISLPKRGKFFSNAICNVLSDNGTFQYKMNLFISFS